METPSTPSDQTTTADQARWFEEEVHVHDGQLKAYLRANYPSVRDVDDVVQESYLRIWKAMARAPIQSAAAFCFRVVQRVALNLIRKDRNAPFDAYGESAALRVMDDSSPDACEAAILQERIELLADALMTLPPRCRGVVILHKIKGYTQNEVAAQLGISERTVETHVRTGVARCLAYLRSRGIRKGDDVR